MTTMGGWVKGSELARRAADKGLTATGIFAEGTATIMGYTIMGSRGSKTVLMPNEDGFYSVDKLVLFVDGIGYATNKIEKRHVKTVTPAQIGALRIMAQRTDDSYVQYGPSCGVKVTSADILVTKGLAERSKNDVGRPSYRITDAGRAYCRDKGL